jgi:hypothetical protein
MPDRIRARGSFVEVTLRNGGVKNFAVGDIKSVANRTEGGSAIRLQNDHIFLVDLPVRSVMEAIELAGAGGGDHATA